MWRQTFFRPNVEDRSLEQVDDIVSQIVEEIYATREVTGDWTTHKIHAIVFETQHNGVNDEVFYAYTFWIDGLEEIQPGPIPGFYSSLVGIRDGFIPGDGDIVVTIDHLADFLEQRFGHEPVAIRRYSAVPPQSAKAELVIES